MRWRRLDVPGHEEARIERSSAGWRLVGQLEVEEGGVLARLRYRVDCDAAWLTREASINGDIGGRPFRLALSADGSGHWTEASRPLPQLAGALDVDLGFTPATNTLPIRRLALGVGESRRVRSAWVRFPELRLEMLDQSYTREAACVYRYAAWVDGALFEARLDTDRHGCVLRYEGLWEAERQTRSASTSIHASRPKPS